MALLLAFLTNHNPRLLPVCTGQGYNPVLQAYRDWLSGDAARYAQMRTAVPTAAPLRLDPLQTRPATLFYGEISASPTTWGNEAYAAFFYYPGPVYMAPAPAH